MVTNYDSLLAIIKISASDLNGSDEEIANRLYIHKSDVQKLKSEYSIGQNAEEKETVILFRYGTSTSLSLPCGQAASNASKDRDLELVKTAVTQAAEEDFSAYVTQQTVYLDFDIISLTFTKDNVSTVIPVAMSPMDVFSHTNPPDEITTRGNMLSWWQILLGIVGLILIVILLIKFLPQIVHAVGKAIALPFKEIKKACSTSKEKRSRRKEEKREQVEKYDSGNETESWLDRIENMSEEEIEAAVEEICKELYGE